MKGVLDRFEEEKAVILIEDKKKEMIVERETLPEHSQVGTWFDIVKVGELHKLSIDQETTEKEQKTSDDLLAKLRAKSKGSKFKTK